MPFFMALRIVNPVNTWILPTKRFVNTSTYLSHTNYWENSLSLAHGREHDSTHCLKVLIVHSCGGGKFSQTYHNFAPPLTKPWKMQTQHSQMNRHRLDLEIRLRHSSLLCTSYMDIKNKSNCGTKWIWLVFNWIGERLCSAVVTTGQSVVVHFAA